MVSLFLNVFLSFDFPARADDPTTSLDPNGDVTIVDPGPPPAPLPDDVRDPVLAQPLDQGGPAPTDLTPDGETTTQVIDDATIDKAAGNATTDVYVPDEGGDHLALVYPEDVNFLARDGNWKDLSLTESPDAFTGKMGETSASFPKTLGPASPIAETFPEGSLSSVLVGADGATAGSTGLEVTYSNVLQATDANYRLIDRGYKETIVLRSAQAPTDIAWNVQSNGLVLSSAADGSILVSATDGAEAGTITPPIAWDQSAEGASSNAQFSLDDLGSGSYRIHLLVDPAFLASAVYPVIIDPSTHDNYDNPATPNRDTYVDGTNATTKSTSYESASSMWVGSSNNKKAYLKFGIDDLKTLDRLVYTAELQMEKLSGSTGSVEAHRVTQDWPPIGNLTWNNKPTVGQIIDPDQTGSAIFKWQLQELYQHYIDTRNATNWPNYGVELEKPNGTSQYQFSSSDSTGMKPTLFLAWNDLPNAPNPDYPGTGTGVNAPVLETPSPKLKVASVPNDPNGDKVYVRFQISDDGVNWSGPHLVFASPWNKQQVGYVVPAGVLTDGQHYYWRAQTWDGYDIKDGAGVTRDYPTSPNVREFTLSLKHLGTDDRWSMWQRTLGNGMNLQVNQANGNLLLDVPLTSLSTQLGPLDLSLSYDSQASAEFGFSPGWDFTAGPDSARDLPVELIKLSPQPDAGLKIRVGGQKTLYFPHDDGRIYGSASAGAGEVRKDNDGNFIYTDTDGGRFTFGQGGRLLSATPAWTKGTANNATVDFNYTSAASDGSQRISQITDPLGRQISFVTQPGGATRITSMTTWDYSHTWTFSYANNKLLSVTDPTNAVTSFVYDANGRITEIKDGVQNNPPPGYNTTGWKITYWNDPTGLARVRTITPPGASGPPANPTGNNDGQYWFFDYPTTTSGYTATTAAWTKVTDPRGTSSATANDYQTQTDFNNAGLPLRVTGPADQSGYWPRHTYVWDTNNNMICERSPAAVAFRHAEGPLDGTCATDATESQYNKVYTYSDKAPYRMTSVTQPASATGAARSTTQYSYDTGLDFNGLWGELFENEKLQGFAKTERMWTDFDHNWSDGQPNGLDFGNNWSFRLTGYLDLTDFAHDRDYDFQVASDDGASVTIEDKSIADCFGQPMGYNTPNCNGPNRVTKSLSPKLHPITIEFSELTGNARFTLLWDGGDGGALVPIPLWRLEPDVGLVTKTTTTISSTGLTQQHTWDYSTDDAKSRRLPISETVSKDDGTDARTTSYTYDKFGRTLTSTAPSGAVTTSDYLDGTSPGTWEFDPNTIVSCMDSQTVKVGSTTYGETQYECDKAGRARKETVKVPSVPGTQQSSATDRVTRTEFDAAGRPVKVWVGRAGSPVTSITPDSQTVYDDAGRPVSTVKLIQDGATPETATTDLTYYATGNLNTTTLPAATAGATRATVTKTYDLVDNVATTSDPRNSAWLTTNTYDASSRLIQTTGPAPGNLTSTTNYKLATGTFGSETYVNQVIATAPTGVSTVDTLDLLGRKTQEQVQNLSAGASINPTTYGYDLIGEVTTETVDLPSTTSDDTTTTTYNVHGQVKTTTQYTGGGAGVEALTSMSYDNGGFLSQIDGPRNNDEINLTNDPLGRVTQVTQPGITIPATSPAVAVHTDITYDNAGERVEMTTPLRYASGAYVNFTRDWTYDDRGRQNLYVDSAETLDSDYNDAGWPTQISRTQGSPSRVQHFVWDDLGRLLSRSIGAGTDSESFGYDLAGNAQCALNSSAAYWMLFDKYSRLTTVRTFSGSSCPSSTPTGTDQTTYTYTNGTGLLSDVDDKQIGLATTNTHLTYTNLAQLDTVADPLTTPSVFDYGYDALGRLKTRTDPASLTWTRAYEPFTGRLYTLTVKKNAANRFSEDLGYDVAGNVTSRTQTIYDSTTVDDSWTYHFDPAGRMDQATPSGGATSTYGYDGASNRTTVQDGAGPVRTTTYDTANRPVTTDGGSQGTSDDVSYTTDPDGNIKAITRPATGPEAGTSLAFTYDGWDRMATSTGSASATYYVDPFGRLASKTVGSTSTTYNYRGLSEQEILQTEGSLPAVAFGYAADDSPADQQISGTSKVFLKDFHDDVIAIASATGAMTGHRQYTPWGEIRSGSTSGDFASPGGTYAGFQGDTTHAETGVVDMGTRYYVPSIGRFTSRDTVFGDLSDPGSLNQYTYAQANPITYTDPTGMRINTYVYNNPEKGAELAADAMSYASAHDYSPDGTYYSPGGGLAIVAPPHPIPPPAPQVAHGDELYGGSNGGTGTAESTGNGCLPHFGCARPVPSEGPGDDSGCSLLGWRCWDDAIGGFYRGGGRVIHGAGLAALDLIATAFYATYYFSYKAASGINWVGSKFGTPGRVISHIIAAPLAIPEAFGLGGDVGIDWIKQHTVNDESIRDEGRTGYINPLHSFLPSSLRGPQLYLPGVHSDGSVDFEW